MRVENEWLKREVNTNEEDYTKVAKNFYNKGKADTVKKMQERVLQLFPSDKKFTTISRFAVDQIAKEMLTEIDK